MERVTILKNVNYRSSNRTFAKVVIPSTKQCACGNTKLVLLRSQNLKICTDCHSEIPWPLTEGQKPLLQ